jgi:hypothetical protein
MYLPIWPLNTSRKSIWALYTSQISLLKSSHALSHRKSKLALRFSIRIARHTKVKMLWSIVKYIAYCGFSCYRIPTTFTDSLRFLFHTFAYFSQVNPYNIWHLPQIFTIWSDPTGGSKPRDAELVCVLRNVDFKNPVWVMGYGCVPYL